MDKLVLLLLVVLQINADADFGWYDTMQQVYTDMTKQFNKYSTGYHDIGEKLPPAHMDPFDFVSYNEDEALRYAEDDFKHDSFPEAHKPYMEPTEWYSNTGGEVYDFIVVGGGSAGSVVANRLTEVPSWNVLLLEVGMGESLFCRFPMFAPILQRTNFNWGYLMEYQPGFALGMEKHRLSYPRGKSLGGTSVINYMMYTRGHPIDYDRWAAMGNPGWSYHDVLPYFMKSEDSKVKIANPKYHGTGGYLSVEDIYRSPLVDTFIKGGRKLGIKYVDYTSNDTMGFSTIQSNTMKGQRHSTARAFLNPIQYRPNLHVSTSSFVTKILIDPHTRKAYGVEYHRHGQTYVVYAKKEVVLSAGAFSSAQLLMLAGIGPKDHLKELGIPLLADLPVGKQMLDHICFVGLTFTINETLSLSADKFINPISIANYLINGKGPWSSLGGVEGIGYIKTHVSDEIEDYPDLELIFVGASVSSDFGTAVRRAMRIRDDIYDVVYRPLQGSSTWTIFPMLVHPKSTGYLKLRSRDPYEYPLLHGNYLTDPEGKDLETLVAGVRFVQKLSKTEPFQAIGSKLSDIAVPGCELYHYDSDQYWECAIRTLSVTMSHQVATNKMGPYGDPESVVDHELKVHGFDHLRVADCSVIPVSVTAHTNAPAIMVGEKAADLIKNTWKNHQ